MQSARDKNWLHPTCHSQNGLFSHDTFARSLFLWCVYSFVFPFYLLVLRHTASKVSTRKPEGAPKQSGQRRGAPPPKPNRNAMSMQSSIIPISLFHVPQPNTKHVFGPLLRDSFRGYDGLLYCLLLVRFLEDATTSRALSSTWGVWLGLIFHLTLLPRHVARNLIVSHYNKPNDDTKPVQVVRDHGTIGSTIGPSEDSVENTPATTTIQFRIAILYMLSTTTNHDGEILGLHWHARHYGRYRTNLLLLPLRQHHLRLDCSNPEPQSTRLLLRRDRPQRDTAGR